MIFPAPGSACLASRNLEIALNSNHTLSQDWNIELSKHCDMLIVDEGSTDVDALRDELKFELVVLHAEVK